MGDGRIMGFKKPKGEKGKGKRGKGEKVHGTFWLVISNNYRYSISKYTSINLANLYDSFHGGY